MQSVRRGSPVKVIFRILLSLLIIGATAAGIFVLYQNYQESTAPPITPPPTQVVEHIQMPAAVIGLPVRLQIPSIEIDAAIVYVGLTADGAMGVPRNLGDVAWYQPGPRPGNAGNAVIAGHTSSRSWVKAAFDDLGKLQPGDKINILDDKAAVLPFVVREIRFFDANADPAEIFAKSDTAHLNLITCTGKFNILTQSFPQRLVVFADAVR